MSGARSALWRTLDRWSPTAFLTAGACMLFTVLIGVLDAVAQLSLEAAAGAAALVGIAISFVGLLGLYPGLAEAAPRLARGGVLLIGLPAAYVVLVLVWLIPTMLVPGWPSLAAMIPGVVQWAVFVPFAAGITVFGVASLRTDVPSRAVGGFLLLLSAAWYVVLGAEVVYEPIPEWVVPVLVVLLTMALLSIGYLLRSRGGRPERSATSSDSAA